MKEDAFAEEVKQHFHYLIDDFGFSVESVAEFGLWVGIGPFWAAF